MVLRVDIYGKVYNISDCMNEICDDLTVPMRKSVKLYPNSIDIINFGQL